MKEYHKLTISFSYAIKQRRIFHSRFYSIAIECNLDSNEKMKYSYSFLFLKNFKNKNRELVNCLSRDCPSESLRSNLKSTPLFYDSIRDWEGKDAKSRSFFPVSIKIRLRIWGWNLVRGQSFPFWNIKFILYGF